MQPRVTAPPTLVWGEPRARWVLAATVLGSALVFIDSTVVNIALPWIGEDLGVGTVGLTWVVTGYSLTLSALVLLGGSLGDRLGRRSVFIAGVGLFAAASALCGLAPDPLSLVAARALQGVGGALLTPASLAILQASFAVEDRGRAIGAWSGLTGVAGAVGPFVGGWLVQVADWRWVFLVNLPVAAAVVVVARRHVPESRDPAAPAHLDVPGAALLAGCLGLLTFGLTAVSSTVTPASVVVLAVGCAVGLGAAFVVRERRAAHPLLPLGIFGSSLFVASNAVTFAMYAALGAVFFALGVVLQVGAGFSPVAAGVSLLPVTVLMLLFSARAGALLARVGPRLPMTLGSAVAAVGAAMLTRIDADADYVRDVLGPVAVLGVGLTLFVGPLTATVLAAVPDAQAGLASGVNNAVARTAGLLAVAAVPVITGLSGNGLLDQEKVLDGFTMLAWGCAGLMLCGSVLSLVFVRGGGADSSGVRRPDGTAAPSVPARRHCSVNTPPVRVPVDAEAGR